MKHSASGKISEAQLFAILLTVRLYSLLLRVRSFGDFALQFLLTVLFSVAATALVSIMKYRSARRLLGFFCLFLAGETVRAYLVFTNDAVHPQFSSLLLFVLIAVSVVYAARLGPEPLARFSALCVIALLAVLAVGCLTNLRSLNAVNGKAFPPEVQHPPLAFLSTLDIPVLYLLLGNKVNGNGRRAMKRSILAAFGVSFCVFLFCVFAFGDALRVYPYPAFTLFELAGFGSFSGLEILFTTAVLSALFLKNAVLLFAGISGLTGGKNEKI